MHDDSGADFLRGGGEMGAYMRSHDWASSPVGIPEQWPQSLRTAVRILLNTGHPMYIFWGDSGICFYNDAYRLSIGTERHPSSLGRPAREVWEEIWPIIGPQIAQVMEGRGATWHENALVPITRNGIRENVYWTYSFGPIDDVDARNGIGGVLVICSETTPQIVAAERLAASAKRLQMALSAGRGIGTWDWDVQKDRVVADERFARLYGVDPVKAEAGAPIAEFFRAIHPADLPRVQERVGHALRSGGLFSEEYRLLQAGGTERWVLAEGSCSLDADGEPLLFSGVSFDITDRKEAEQRIRLLMREVNHRVKNQFSVILSMIRETTKRASSAKDFEAQIRRRITALSESHDLLVMGDWRGSEINELLAAQIRPFGARDQVQFSGPSVVLSASATQYLGIAFHELATNSAIHGALARSTGKVMVTWDVGSTSGCAPQLTLLWKETGYAVETKPVHKGFGTVVLERVTPQAVSGSGSLDYSDGLTWTLVAPLAAIGSTVHTV
ncbi:sensor histidine kinase [Mesorhizobium kowhaii]|uniref:sensor histidine kinase n=1 Tax=Mesorhizobium kowhaii TaxID=1300272 RepID=UPI0035EDFB41